MQDVKWALRDRLLRGVVWFGAAALAITEIFGAFHLLRRGPLLAAWLLIAGAAAISLYRRRPSLAHVRMKPVESAIAFLISAIVAVTGLTAWMAPPNTYDAMAYHMPRVVYWAQSGSVGFFPTTYYNQVSFPPLAEYLVLHTYVISGGDHFVNLLATLAFAGCIIGVSAIAAAMGVGSKGQALAALVCATLPNAILQASGAKNDTLLALWLVTMVYFAVCGDVPLAALSCALALATKGTAYVFAPPLMLGAWWISRKGRPYRLAAWVVAACLLLNGPQYIRNIRLSGSPLGFDTPFGDGRLPWRNAHPGWKATVSNALRNLSDQLGTSSAARNQQVFQAVLRVHAMLGIDPQSPDTTWNDASYTAPLNTRHEANANNRWHLLLLAIAAVYAAWRDRRWLAYAASLVLAFLLFCFWLRWQPYGARLLLPFFVAGAPLGGFLLDRIRPMVLTLLVCLFLADTARLPALQNWTRPLRGPGNLFVTRRDDNYFADIRQHHNEASYRAAVDRVARSGCNRVGIDIWLNQLEYPFQALLRERNPRVHFVHAPTSEPVCTVLCLDCAGNESKVTTYRNIGPPVVLGQFVLFLPERLAARDESEYIERRETRAIAGLDRLRLRSR